MKPTVILPIVTAIAGFGLAWVIKPAPQAGASSVTKTPERERQRSAPAAPIQEEAPERSSPPPGTPGNATQPLDAAQAIGELKNRDEAKLARLVEALSLNEGQKAAVLKAVSAADTALKSDEGSEAGKIMQVASQAAADLEKAILALLTPEQAAAFAALRQRSQDNNVESNSQDQVSKFSKAIDLSPEQRELMLARIRDDVRKEYEQRPQGLDLLLDTSPLPTGTAVIADSSVASMALLAGGEDPAKNMETMQAEQRKNLDAQVDKYKDILTPAQLSRLQVEIEEKKRILDIVREHVR